MSEQPPWYQQTPEATLKQLTSHQNGLSQSEAEQRQTHYGPNTLGQVKSQSRLRLFLRQFHNLVIYILLAAAVATALLQEWVDTAVIVAVVLINGLVGYIQEGKAERALAAVRNLLAPRARVLRDGTLKDIDARDLVPGDIVQVKAGDRIPADVRLLSANELRADESLLTGESLPVDKTAEVLSGERVLADQNNMLWSGTLVASGRARGVVVATGKQTELGRINELLAQVDTLATPLLRQLDTFGKQITLVIGGLSLLAFAVGYWIQDYTAREMFMAAVGLAVAAIPEGLPAVVTITLALGVQRMARRNAIVRRLPAVETLGSVTVICSDKTGTLTRNEMTATRVRLYNTEYSLSGSGYTSEGSIEPGDLSADARTLLETALLCNDTSLIRKDDSWHAQGAPTEAALALAAIKGGLHPERTPQDWPRLDTIPFDSAHKFMATLNQGPEGQYRILMSGAPEAIMDRCSHQRVNGEDQPLDTDYWHQVINDLAHAGLRTLALANRTLPEPPGKFGFSHLQDCTLLGVIGIIDPPRDEAITAIAACHSAGIRVVMITGDHAGTARAIGTQLGIPSDHSLTGKELDQLTPEDLHHHARNTHIFARVSPENKLQLVTALQEQGDVVAMTGDGVNDAPALKRADIGVAMGGKGTEAAKEASEIVLADDNFASISRAVREGRTVYTNIRKSIAFIAPTNGGQAMTILMALVIGMTIPVTPVHILWVNMVTAVTLSLTLAFERSEADVMQQPPRHPQAGLVDGFLLWRIAFVSLLMVSITFSVFSWAQMHGADLESARTLAVNTLVMLQVCYLFNSRFLIASSANWKGLTGNLMCWYAVAVVVVLQLLFTYSPWLQHLFGSKPLQPETWLIIIASGLLLFTLVELEKMVWRRIKTKRQQAAEKG